MPRWTFAPNRNTLYLPIPWRGLPANGCARRVGRSPQKKKHALAQRSGVVWARAGCAALSRRSSCVGECARSRGGAGWLRLCTLRARHASQVHTIRRTTGAEFGRGRTCASNERAASRTLDAARFALYRGPGPLALSVVRTTSLPGKMDLGAIFRGTPPRTRASRDGPWGCPTAPARRP